jgi:predicted ester cyclase
MRHADDLHQAYRDLIAAIEANDPDALTACMSSDIVDHAALPDQPRGVAGIVVWMQGMHESLSGLRGMVEDTVVEEDKVAGRVAWSGIQTGTFVGLPATGKPVTFRAMHVLRFEDGLAVEWWGVPDVFGALTALGAASRAAAGMNRTRSPFASPR